jgi:acetyl-CoA synthetase
MMAGMGSTDAFRAARELLIRHREDHARATADFRWPDVGGAFDWARDWFDEIARDNDRTALWIVEEDGREQRVSFERMRAR